MEKVLRLDLKTVPVTQRHPMIFDSWETLSPESVLQIVSDHDPKIDFYTDKKVIISRWHSSFHGVAKTLDDGFAMKYGKK